MEDKGGQLHAVEMAGSPLGLWGVQKGKPVTTPN